MDRFFSYPLILFLSSLVPVIFGYLNVNIKVYQQIIALLLALSIVLINLITKYSSKDSRDQKISQLLIKVGFFIGSLFTQLLIFSSGDLYSPFLILIYILYIALSFFINTKTAFYLLVFFTVGLAFHLLNNSLELEVIKGDIGSVLIYITSFFVAVPLSIFLAKKYHLKSYLADILSKELEIDESILETISEIAIVTDENLLIQDVNPAFSKILKFPHKTYIGKPLLEIINLKNSNGTLLSRQSLLVDQSLNQNSIETLDNLQFFTPLRIPPFPVSVTIRPINNPGFSKRLSILISQTQPTSSQSHTDLEKAIKTQEEGFQTLEKQLRLNHQDKLNLGVELLKGREDDLLILQELIDHSLHSVDSWFEVVSNTQDIISSLSNLTQALGVSLKLSIPNSEVKEMSYLNLHSDSTFPQEILSSSDFSVPTDPKWMRVLIGKLVKLALYLSTYGPGKPEVTCYLTEDNSNVNLFIIGTFPKIEKNQEQFLFSKYYGDLNISILKQSSGLEGFLAKSIAYYLNVPLSFDEISDKGAFHLTLSKIVKS